MAIRARPGKTKKDTRGEAYFVGEEERMQYLNKCDMEAIAAKKQVRREGPASAARHCVALEVAKSNTTAIPADHTASSLAESSQRRPHQLSATVSSPPPSLEKTSSGIVGVCPQDTTFHTASDLAASSQGSRISGRNSDPDAFAGFGSDAENDDGDNGDDDDSVVDVFDRTDVQVPVPPEMRFEDQLLDAIGGTAISNWAPYSTSS
ncbi:hypothetical protein JG687_00008302 [Phytophthora cactorum]|uniref:Uncharacterized protein n=1 Tax=Phytophthora cactorum TaxID=29920 RepID=A0A8T1UEN5_9STRA|nr:hypothetical protein JG687_00008302 [Phytophthora cactorum]